MEIFKRLTSIVMGIGALLAVVIVFPIMLLGTLMATLYNFTVQYYDLVADIITQTIEDFDEL